MNSDQRGAARFDTALPVYLAGTTGETHNISAQGVYFETDVRQEVGALVNFTLEFTLYGERHQLLCEGKVIRVDTGNGRIGVAARLVTPFFAETETVAA
jgi:hypothetical protein